MKTVRLHFIALAFVLGLCFDVRLVFGADPNLPPLTADSYWAWAEKKSTPQAYRLFVKSYPKDPRVEKAEDRRAQMDFAQATKEGTRSALHRFQRLHPNSPLVDRTSRGFPLGERSAGTQVELPVYNRAMDKLCTALRDRDADVRSSAATALGQIGDSRAVDPLVIALKDNDKQLRRAVVYALGQLGDARAIDPLVIALKDNDNILRRAVAYALGQIGDPRAIDPLVTVFKDPDYEVREFAAYALGNIGDSRAIDLLVTLFKDTGRNARVPESAAYALGHIGDSRAIDPLLTTLKGLPYGGNMRWPVAEALREIGDNLAVDRLVTALKDADWNVRCDAAHVLGMIRNPGAVEPLASALKDNDKIVRLAVAEALGVIGDSRAVEPLVIALKDPEPLVREAAAKSLGELGEARAVEPLVAALKDASWLDNTDYIMYALRRIGDTRAANSLVLTLKSDQRNVRDSAASVLGWFGDARAVEPLVATLNDAGRHKYARESAAWSLCNIRDARAFDSLVTAMKGGDPYVRVCAARVLGIRGDARAVDSLVAALKDVDRDVGYNAAKALGKIGDARAIDQLVIALNVGTPAMRGAALATLAQIGDSHAVNPLVTMLKDRYSDQTEYFYLAIFRVWDGLNNGLDTELSRMGPDLGARTMATKALAEIVMKNGIGLLKSALHDPDPRMRQGTTAVLAKVAEQRQELLLGSTSKAEAKPAETTQESGQREPTILEKIKAAGSRASTGDLAGLPQLKGGLKNPQIEVQFAAITGLSQAKDQKPVVVENFKAALAETKSDTVKLKLIGELAKMQDPTALADLKKYVKSEDPVERSYAAEVLGQTGKGNVAEELVAALDDPDALVRVYAATAIIRVLRSQAGPQAINDNRSRQPEAKP